MGFERETRNALGGQERVLDGALDIGLRDREKLRQERIGAGGLPVLASSAVLSSFSFGSVS